MPAYHVPDEEPRWPFNPAELECTCNHTLCLAGVAQWCAFCQAEYTAWLEEEADKLPMEFYVLSETDVVNLEAFNPRKEAA
jgi:hypothetical protein